LHRIVLPSCITLHYHVEEDRFVMQTNERNPSRKSKNARPSGRLVFVSIFARGRVRRRCSRQGMVQLIDAMVFESIPKLHHPLYREENIDNVLYVDPSAT
jgi:hypothetical protein